MKNIFAIIFATLAGVSTSLEAFINGELGKSTTALVATFISLTVGSLVLVGFFIDSVILGQETMHLYKYIGVILLILGTFFIVN